MTALRGRFPDVKVALALSRRAIPAGLEDCIVCIDASALLAPYDFTSNATSLTAILSALRRLKDENALRVPAHSLREYLSLRGSKLASIVGTLQAEREEYIHKPGKHYACLEDVDAYKDLSREMLDMRRKNDTIRAFYDAIIIEVSSWSAGDPISLAYAELFENCIVDIADTSYDTIADEYNKRVSLGHRPGLLDSSKKINKEGDYIIWKTILESVAPLGKDIVLVTQEHKDDWWVRSSQSPLFPHSELQVEYNRISGGSYLHILSLSELLRRTGASVDAVSGIEQVEASSEHARLAEECISVSAEIMELINSTNVFRYDVSFDRGNFAAESMRRSDNIMSAFRMLYLSRCVYLANRLVSIGLLEKSDVFRFEHPTNPLGVEDIAIRLGACGHELRARSA
jgi:hypothetical protein